MDIMEEVDRIKERIRSEIEEELRNHPCCACLDSVEFDELYEIDEDTVYFSVIAGFSGEIFGHVGSISMEINGTYNKKTDEITVDSIHFS